MVTRVWSQPLSGRVRPVRALACAEDGPRPQGESEEDSPGQALILAAPLFCRTVCTTAPQPFCT